MAFIKWAVEHGYKKGLQLDRIDVNGNYEPNNCQWTTPKINSRNRRNTVFLTIKGETRSIAEHCEKYNILNKSHQRQIYRWVHKFGALGAESRFLKLVENPSLSIRELSKL